MHQPIQRCRGLLCAFLAEERGQDLVEYALVVALLAFSAVAGMRSLAAAISTVFTNVTAILSSTVT